MNDFHPIPDDSSVAVELTNDVIGLVDADLWFGCLDQHTWYACNHGGRWYMASSSGGFAHRMISQLRGWPQGLDVDHIQHPSISDNMLDNRSRNLRMATRAQNCQNRRVRCDSKSGVKGVVASPNKTGKPWRAHIRVNGKRIWLGYFNTTEEAGRAYDEAAIKHFGEFACTNF